MKQNYIKIWVIVFTNLSNTIIKEKMTQEIYYKKIEIPHLQATLFVYDMSKLKTPNGETGGGYSDRQKSDTLTHYNYCLFLQDIENTVKNPRLYSYIAHEVMHIIQFILEDYRMDITEEKEHTAYLMKYLLDEIIK